jgi:hypothetical protein
VAVEYLVAFAGIPIAIAILFGRHRPALVGIAIAAALVPIAGLMLYHDAAFGSPWSTGYHHVVDPVFAEKHGQGLLGLSAPRLDGFIDHVLAPDTGLLWWIPAVGWAVWGLGLAAKGAGAAATVARVWLAILGLFVLASTMLSFDGGWRVGPRYMVAVLPALMWGWSSAWTRLQSLPPTVARLNLALVGALAAYQVIVNVLAGSLWPHLDPTNIHAPLADVLVPLLLAGRVPYTAFGVAVPAVLQWLAMAAIVVAALGVIVAGLAGGIDGRERRLGALAMGIALGSFAVVAVSLLPAHPKAAANLAYIERVWEPPTAGAARSQTLELASAKNGP